MLDYDSDVSLEDPSPLGSNERFDIQCPECQSLMTLRRGRYRMFYGCPNYPDCRETHRALLDGSPVPGPVVTRKVKALRQVLYEDMNQILDRDFAYAWASRLLNVPYVEGKPFLSLLDEQQCTRLIEALRKDFPCTRGYFDVISLGGIDLTAEESDLEGPAPGSGRNRSAPTRPLSEGETGADRGV